MGSSEDQGRELQREEVRRRQEEERRRAQRSLVAKYLGDGWVEAEPGIFYPPMTGLGGHQPTPLAE